MDHPQRLPAGEDVQAVLTEALNFLMNSWRGDPSLRSAIDRALGCLEGGDTNDQAHAQTLKAYVSYPGSTAAQMAAVRLHAAILTAEGRRASDLPRRTRGSKKSGKNIPVNSELFQLLLAIEMDKKQQGLTIKQRKVLTQKARFTFDTKFGEASLTTRAKVRKELKAKVQRSAEFWNQFLEAKANKTQLK
jgi:hypothetical protein